MHFPVHWWATEKLLKTLLVSLFLITQLSVFVCVCAAKFKETHFGFLSRTWNQQNSESEKHIAFTRFSMLVYTQFRYPMWTPTHVRWKYIGNFPFVIFMNEFSVVQKCKIPMQFVRLSDLSLEEFSKNLKIKRKSFLRLRFKILSSPKQERFWGWMEKQLVEHSKFIQYFNFFKRCRCDNEQWKSARKCCGKV